MDPQIDHDLLVELKTEMKGVRVDIKEIRDNIGARVSALEAGKSSVRISDDHEKRLRKLEDDVVPKITNRIAYWSGGLAVLMFLIGLAIKFYH